ncbi:orotate phosphoribosyltransferase [Salsuginibacillus halophilus]|uniref:Orotate phosphoribosyltransferase n=1 Tax=Salsuginibacillus halophilus TaxID=517424 RepID=A0A2P8HX37_9BACI|nr:orotate phosphoribosyltransferase [Salsuginibacillus halophilus]PSL50744.1 orotate phosphoribosyltransferase [Salsuginibacillus halophilus]
MKEMIAKHLLEIEAVNLSPKDPFTWTSGIASPIYCDNRLILSFPHVRRDVIDGFTQLVQTHYPEAEVIAGTATAGIPHAAWVSEALDLPMIYVRGKAKGHGKGNQIEGTFARGAKVVVLEDLISTGKSVIEAAEALREAGADVLGGAAVFTYELSKGETNLAEARLEMPTLTNMETLRFEALQQKLITENESLQVAAFCANPDDASWQSMKPS